MLETLLSYATVLAVAILFPIMYGVFYRMHGGAKSLPQPPWKITEIATAVAPCIILYYVAGQWAAIATVFAVAGFKTFGQGQWMNLRFPGNIKAITAETLDFIVRLFFGKDPRVGKKGRSKEEVLKAVQKYGVEKLYWRNVLGLFVSGSSVFIVPAGILAYAGHPIVGAVMFLLPGFAKSLGYMTGAKYLPQVTMKVANLKISSTMKKDMDEATEIGEALGGIGAGCAIAFAIISLFLI